MGAQRTEAIKLDYFSPQRCTGRSKQAAQLVGVLNIVLLPRLISASGRLGDYSVIV